MATNPLAAWVRKLSAPSPMSHDIKLVSSFKRLGPWLAALANAKRSGRRSRKLTSGRKAYWMMLISVWYSNNDVIISSTCCVLVHPKSFLMCSIWEATAFLTKMNKCWSSQWSRKKCNCLLKNVVKYMSINFTRTWWRKFDSWRTRSSSIRTNSVLTFSARRCASTLPLARNICKNSITNGKSASKSTNKSLLKKFKACRSIMSNRWKL